MPAEIEDDGLALALLLAPQRLVDGPAHGMRGLGGGEDALRARELDGRLEGRRLRHGAGLDHALVVELADERGHAVIAEPARVHGRGDEGVAERVHLDERREPDRIAEIVDVLPLGQARAGAGLDGHDAQLLLLAGELVRGEGEGEAREVRPAADAAHDDVGLGIRLLELLPGLEADHGLVHQHVVQHAAEGVLGVIPHRRVLDRLADRDAEAARRVRILLEDLLAGLGVRARARHDLGAEGLHQDAPIRLLLIGDLDHVDLALQAEEAAGLRQGRAPLAGAGLGRQARDALLLVVVRLRDGRVGLVAARRAHALVLVVDVGRRIERLLEPARAIERRGPPQAQDVPHLVGDLDPPLLAHLLLDQLHREEGREVLGADGLAGAGMERRRERRLEVRLDVVPLGRHLLLGEQVLRGHVHRLPRHDILLR
jgi:hypothetical protein